MDDISQFQDWLHLHQNTLLDWVNTEFILYKRKEQLYLFQGWPRFLNSTPLPNPYQNEKVAGFNLLSGMTMQWSWNNFHSKNPISDKENYSLNLM